MSVPLGEGFGGHRSSVTGLARCAAHNVRNHDTGRKRLHDPTVGEPRATPWAVWPE